MKELKWSISEQIIVQLTSFATNILLMFFLLPEDFGVFAIPLLVFAFARVIQDFGTTHIVFTKEKIDIGLAQRVYGFTIITTLLIGVLMLIFMPKIVTIWTNNVVSGRIMKILSILYFATAPSIAIDMVLRRNLEYKKLFWANVISILVSSLLGIILASNSFKYDALVYRQVAFIVILNILLFAASNKSFRPIFKFDWLKESSSFTLPLITHQLLNFTTRNFDNLFIGRYLGNEMLGLYDRSYKILILPLDQISHVASRVFLPKFADNLNNTAYLTQMVERLITVLLLCLYPIIIFTHFFIDLLITNILDKAWFTMIPLLKIFIWIIPAQMISVICSNIILPFKKTFYMMVMTICSTIVLMSIFLYFTKYSPSLFNLVLGYAIVAYAVTLTLSVKVVNLLSIGLSNYIAIFIKTFVPFMVLFMFFMIAKFAINYHIVFCILTIIISLSLYIYLVFLVYPDIKESCINMANKRILRFNNKFDNFF